MNRELKLAFASEMDRARSAYAAGDLDPCFRHLEQAHILGQRALFPHLVTHWWMLQVGIRRSDVREIKGQIARMVAAIFGWIFGWVPIGNTGGADVSPIKSMPVPAAYQHFFDSHDVRRHARRRLVVIMIIGMIGIIFITPQARRDPRSSPSSAASSSSSSSSPSSTSSASTGGQ